MKPEYLSYPSENALTVQGPVITGLLRFLE